MFYRQLNVPFIGLICLYHRLIKDTKEVPNMKAATITQRNFANRPHAPYPNAATYKELAHKMLDLLLMAAIGTGAAAILLFLLVLG